jgi:Leucine-rich repeat (LRR) protein
MIGFGQNVSIPDANFKAYLVGNSLINTNGDTEIQVSEATAFNGSIICNYMSISDLTGIEDFTALTTLRCDNNQLTSLDVSGNTALTYLHCHINQLTSLDLSQNTSLFSLGCSYNQLTSLDVSNNIALNYLWCDNNQLTTLDVSQNTALVVFTCKENQITALDLSQNTALIHLQCDSNELTSLDLRNGNNINMQTWSGMTIDFTNNPNLFCIDVDDVAWSTANWTLANGNIAAWTSFSLNCNPIYGCTDSTALNFNPLADTDDGSCAYPMTYVPDDNFEQALINLGYDNILDDSVVTANIDTVTFLYLFWTNIADLTGIEDFTALTELRCHNSSLTSLDVSGNTALTYLDCSYNNIISLDVSANTALTYLDCGSNQLTTLDVKNGNNTNFTYFVSWSNYNLYCIDVDDTNYSNTNWTYINFITSFSTDCATAFGCLDPIALNYDSTATIDDGSCTYPCTYIPDDNFEAYLEAIGKGNGILNDDSVYTPNINTLTSLDVSGQQISDLTGIAAFNSLTTLDCSFNQLDSLNLSNHPTLEELTAEYSGGANLDVSGSTMLSFINCNGNNLTDVNVNGVINLEKLWISNFQGGGYSLTNLDVSTNINLIELWCSFTGLSSLDVSGAAALTTLRCEENQLTSLDVNNNTALTFLDCSVNYIECLDISNNLVLTNLDCSNNLLEQLNTRNGNFQNMSVDALSNNLTCVEVDNIGAATNNWSFDSFTSLNTNCNYSNPCNMIYGCTDLLACNYNSSANIDDSSCVYPSGIQQSFSICNGDSVIVGSSVYDTTGNYIDTLTAGNGCDSIVYTNISIAAPIVLQWGTSICNGDSVIVGNSVYNTAGNYTDTLATTNGCDSIVYTNITMDYNTSSFDTLSVTASIVWNGMPLNASGDYSVTLNNLAGCDSIVNLNLTITTTGISDIVNTKSNLVKITDMLGQKTPYRRNTPLFYIYDDGTVEKRIVIE